MRYDMLVVLVLWVKQCFHTIGPMSQKSLIASVYSVCVCVCVTITVMMQALVSPGSGWCTTVPHRLFQFIVRVTLAAACKAVIKI